MSKYPGRIVTDLAPAGYSVYFDGSGDRIQTASNAALALGTNDFSIEWWERRDAIGSDDTPVSTGDYSSAYASCLLGYSGTAGYISTNGASWNVLNGPAYVDPVLPNVWNHFVYTRSGTAFRVFMNGKLSNYVTGSGSVVQNNNRFNVGGNSGGAQYDVPGYISNFRVVIGSIPTQYQTSSTTVGTQVFTPPTQLSLVTNTVLLACNSPSIIDQSSNNIAFTVTGNALVSTITPFPAYVPYNPALGASTPGVWTLDEAMQARQTRRWNMYDPYFNSTVLLLRSGAVDGSQNNTFLDSGTANGGVGFTITRNPTSGPNAPTQGTFSPFSQTGWSVFFDGTGDFLNFASSASFGYGTGDYTIEGWVWSTTRSVANTFFANGTDNCNLYIKSSTGIIGFYTGSVNDSTTALPLNQWNHIAVVRNGSGSNNTQVYLNGTSILTITNTTNFSNTTFFIGRNGAAGSEYMNGYISNVRVTKGRAVYTSSFTPPASPLGKTSGGQNPPQGTECTLLTCQSNRFVDNSDAALTVTRNADSSVQPFSPFYPTAAYTPQTIGGSGYFDGTGDYLSIAASSAFNFGAPSGNTNDFTIEMWVYPTRSAFVDFELLYGTGGSGGQDQLNLYANGTAQYYDGTNNVISPALRLNQWNHVAVVRNGASTNNLRVYANGVSGTAVTSTAALGSSVTSPRIGLRVDGFNPYQGYISNVRVVKGTAVYTGAYSPPIAPLATSGAASASAYSSTTNVNTTFTSTNTSLLTNFTNAAITDATGKNVLETVGNAQASTSVRNTRLVTTPPTSMYFDGTGDYLQTAPSQLFNVGASDFTIEFWIYPTSFASVTYPMYSTTARAKSDVLAFEVGTAGTIVAYVTASGGGAWSIVSAGNVGTLTLNTWNHVALVRNGSAFRGYVNGVQGGMTTSSSSAVASFDGWNIGFNGASAYFTGYIDDLRITRSARYTGPFTPPRSRLQEQ